MTDPKTPSNSSTRGNYANHEKSRETLAEQHARLSLRLDEAAPVEDVLFRLTCYLGAVLSDGPCGGLYVQCLLVQVFSTSNASCGYIACQNGHNHRAVPPHEGHVKGMPRQCHHREHKLLSSSVGSSSFRILVRPFSGPNTHVKRICKLPRFCFEPSVLRWMSEAEMCGCCRRSSRSKA